MEVFKIFESTIPNVEPGHPNTKDLRRDQLMRNYDEAIETLRTLIRAKKSEITYRRDLIEMLDKSKSYHDNKLSQAKQLYSNAKNKQGLSDQSSRSITSSGMKTESANLMQPLPPSYNGPFVPSASQANPMLNIPPPPMGLMPPNMGHPMNVGALPPPHPSILSTDPSGFLRSSNKHLQQQQISSPQKSFNDPMDIALSASIDNSQSQEIRSSLDARLSNFLKTFGGPNSGSY